MKPRHQKLRAGESGDPQGTVGGLYGKERILVFSKMADQDSAPEGSSIGKKTQ